MVQEAPFSWATRCNELLQSLDASSLSRVQSFASKDAVDKLVKELQHQRKNLQKNQILSRMKKISGIIDPLAIAADSLSQGAAVPSHLFWGLLALSIQVSASRTEFIDITFKTYEALLSVVPRFESYLEILQTCPSLSLSIQNVFVAYASLSRQCVKTFDKGFNFLRQLKWIRYQYSFEETLRRLRKLTEVVHTEAGFELERISLHVAEERHHQLVVGQQEVLSAVTGNLASLDIDEKDKFMIPYPSNTAFTGRSRELDDIHQALQGADTNPVGGQRVVAICGLGGVGKSQLALKYAHDYRSHYKACFWVTCDSAVKIDGDFATIAIKLGIPNLGLHQNREQLKHWFSKAGRDCLLIFDNAENVTELSEFWPYSSKCCIILTSQNSSWLLKENVSYGIALKSLTTAESFELLKKTTEKQGRSIDYEAGAAIVKETGGLPLAIRHIGSYICAMGTNVAEFLADYQNESEASAIDAWSESAPSWYSHTLSTFLNYAFERLTPDAISLLTVIIFLDSEAIDETIFLQASGTSTKFMPKSR
ncbi:P-loop containing nucleoside triphosphate hydrolase protein [Lophiotrema nucula]|uniref:P-loop containing nucleoside triphosphate hydrolase protein n=1 Tax=Lophiotrema nucula TaxID=690887 RepID=A0A6A5YHL0_9PLEO|nr:P-loop containing nucleoside triphosphate hydrolase protein [Lophiotrema nucula]